MQLTPHLTDAMLAAALDRNGVTSQALQLHLMECESCRADLAEARSHQVEIGHLLDLLDDEPPKIEAEEFVRRVAWRSNAAKSVMGRGRSWGRKAVSWSVAAAILTASVTAAALVPNSIIQRLIHRVVTASPIGHTHSSIAAAEKPVAQSESPRGVELPLHGRIDVLFHSSQISGVVRVVPATTAQLSVEADGDGPAYTVGENTIIVTNRASDSTNFTVKVPALADSESVYISIGGRVAYANIGSHVTAQAPVAANGQVLLPLDRLQRTISRR